MTTVVVASVLSDEVNVIGVVVVGKMRVPGSAEAAADVAVELNTSVELDSIALLVAADVLSTAVELAVEVVD